MQLNIFSLFLQNIEEVFFSKKNFPSVYILQLFSLAMDGTTGAIQDNIRRFYKFSGHSMMYSMNLFSSCYLLVALLFTGELFSFLSFIYIYPFVMKNLLILGAVSAMGQVNFFFLFCSNVRKISILFIYCSSFILLKQGKIFQGNREK